MVLQFTCTVLLCLVLIMCGRSDAVKDFEEKDSISYNIQKNVDSGVDAEERGVDSGIDAEERGPFLSLKTMEVERYHMKNSVVGLFSIDDLRALHIGKKLPIFLPGRHKSLYPPFLPKEVADTIPFSSSQVSRILQLFSVPPNSPKGEAVLYTLKECEMEATKGENKICATSLESMLGFVRKAFAVGPEVDFKFISASYPTLTTPVLQNYTVSEPPREIHSAQIVPCHPLPYLYAIYFCHFDSTETKAFKFQLVGDSGDKVDALVVCHMDTSGWSPDHLAFRMLDVQHGNPICHMFSEGNIVWIQPSATLPSKSC